MSCDKSEIYQGAFKFDQANIKIFLRLFIIRK